MKRLTCKLVCVMSLSLLLSGLLACQQNSQPDQTETTDDSGLTSPTQAAATPTPDPDHQETEDPGQTTEEPSQETDEAQPSPTPEPPAMIDLNDVGLLRSGHTVLIPGGQWYDATRQPRLFGVEQLRVEASGTGKPTLSQPNELSALISIVDGNDIVFSGIRFGYQRDDFTADDIAGTIPLIEIINSTSIRFENCEFFGSAGAAVSLSGSENIEFINCQFYNNAGLPLITDIRNRPNQLLFKDSSFESTGSGLLPLYLRDSRFENCTFVGTEGYLVPAFDTSCEQTTLYAASLYSNLENVLAARIEFDRDLYQVLTIQNSLFISSDIYSLYGRIESAVMDSLPSQWLSVSLTGEKADDPGAAWPLSSELGLNLTLRTLTGSDGSYTLENLQKDLQPLRQLPGIVYDLIDGEIQVALYDQHNQPLLRGQINLSRLQTLLDETDPLIWLTQSSWTLLNPQLVPEEFSALSLGRIAAQDARQVLANSWLQSGTMFFAPEADPDQQIMIEVKLDYQGTRLQADAAYHQFSLLIERSARSDQPDCIRLIQVADIAYRAADGEKNDQSLNDDGLFTLPNQMTRQALLSVLAVPLRLTISDEMQELSIGDRSPDASSMMLRLPAASNPIYWSASPVLVLPDDELEMKLKIVLYDNNIRPWLVQLDINLDETGSFTLENAVLLD